MRLFGMGKIFFFKKKEDENLIINENLENKNV